MINIYIRKTRNPKKFIMSIYKDDELRHSYVDTYERLFNMTKILWDIENLNIYQDKKLIYTNYLKQCGY